MSEAEYAAAPPSLTVREFKAGGKIMVATLRSPKVAPKAERKTLHQPMINCTGIGSGSAWDVSSIRVANVHTFLDHLSLEPYSIT